MSEIEFWKKCSTCKKPIAFNATYQRCSVSTCNHSRSGLVFCSVSCWSGHVPVYRHRDAWAIEEKSPSREAWAREEAAAPASSAASPVSPSAPKTFLARPSTGVSSSPTTSVSGLSNQDLPVDVLIVVSKLKAYIKARGDMNTSADVMDILSEKVRRLCDEAILHARQEGRKTVMARDF